MNERIQKIISARGVASRRQAEAMIQDGRVTVNGQICSLGQTVDPDTDIIMIDNQPLPMNEKRVYILLNKPRGYVTTLSDEKGRKNAAQLVKDCGTRVYTVGRLDMDSEGLLLFTNDGEFANRLMHPSHQIDKTYQVTVKGFSAAGLEQLKQPVTLDGYTIRPPKVSIVRIMNGPDQKAVLLVTIHEGRNRQVRRMCAIAGMQVTRLVRISEGHLNLGDLPTAKWRYLTPDEVELFTK